MARGVMFVGVLVSLALLACADDTSSKDSSSGEVFEERARYHPKPREGYHRDNIFKPLPGRTVEDTIASSERLGDWRSDKVFPGHPDAVDEEEARKFLEDNGFEKGPDETVLQAYQRVALPHYGGPLPSGDVDTREDSGFQERALSSSEYRIKPESRKEDVFGNSGFEARRVLPKPLEDVTTDEDAKLVIGYFKIVCNAGVTPLACFNAWLDTNRRENLLYPPSEDVLGSSLRGVTKDSEAF